MATLSPEDIIARANHHGATFELQADGTWTCIAKKRGRPMPIATFNDPSQAEAAAMFLRYFGHRQ